MRKIKNFIKKGILIFGILLSLTNCEKEDLVQTESATKLSQKKDLNIDKIKKSFSLKNYQDNFVKENLKVKWDQYDLYTGSDNSEIYEFMTNLNSKISSLKGKKYFFSKYTLQVVFDAEGNLSFKIIRYFSNNKDSLKKITNNSISGFSGTITYFNNNGKVLKLEGYSKGIFIEEFGNQSNKSISAREAPIANGTWVPMIIERWTDWYQDYLGGGIMFYSHSSNYSVTVEWVYVDTGGSSEYSGTYHSHSDEPHIGSGTYPDPDSIDNHVEEILIDPSFENIDKIYCTLNKLLTTTTIKSLLKDFFGSDADYDLVFKVEENLVCNGNSIVNGCTNANYDPTDNKVVISIDKDYINNTQTPTLFLARTILHESIHANLYLAVKKLNGGTSPSNNDFSLLYEEYRQKKGWQHEMMADKYRNLIAQGLKNVHPLLGDQSFINYYSSNTLWSWDKFYDELSWLGLYDTTIGQEHIQNPNYSIDASLYVDGAKVNSTKTPKCD
ncbi:hypothetical protein [uncultured Lutibacter sp.]|uniref:hypothetical protein n=1 Tax=uncultured Lutibacter sp. TaxID=437739 RepID=UPI00260C008B|nr:hypothetical protein [uncultured Lutibacter sp.]